MQFLNGPDGEPWVWVMGEHPDDLPIEQILELEARDKARQQAELEAQQLRYVALVVGPGLCRRGAGRAGGHSRQGRVAGRTPRGGRGGHGEGGEERRRVEGTDNGSAACFPARERGRHGTAPRGRANPI